MTIDWTNPKAKISNHFTVHEALWLPSWHIYHTPTETEKANIIVTAQCMDKVRDLLNVSINVSVWIRPKKVDCATFDPKTIKIDEKDSHKELKEKALAALDYNLFIGSTATKSAHIVGSAVDWIPSGMTCDAARKLLKEKLDEFEIRIEALDGSPWVHVDTKWVKDGHNYFIP